MNPTSKIYYAHSKLIYGTSREKEELDFLERKYPEATIINPNDLGELKDIKKYLKIVGKCKLVVVSELDDYVGKGVFAEISRALSNDIRVKVLRNKDNVFFLTNVSGLEIINEHDWKSKYARLIVNL